ncbi:DUF3386 domain-containing protein [Prochlorococcus marinus]|uniref:DUF3386 domain-containing protein n=1 Tax=Prochlorococcus marinus XMU1408 TaxID=2213228 RepID=A0A318R2Z6_PROMR|nr:DUF3386 domain-containing protein [Prochlorococcus marinus]MBW3042557.1 hypothetical protein [Prochlorococcus marinus str. XMU1408]PYE01281.1 hypothetical protein DNJ73_07670 [Prochlorococcus marinus XMU1408]
MKSNEEKVAQCTQLFKAAYENRYTWDSDFIGYQGNCSWTDGEKKIKGIFTLGQDLKTTVNEIDDEKIKKAVSSQLWEVAIHRVRRSFEQTHGKNIFTFGDTNEIGSEILVGGKNEGDKYRVKNNVVTMVYRHIHGNLIIIHTKDVTHTGNGYLSKSYSSQYLDPISKKALKGKSFYEDEFIPLFKGGPWVLASRSIQQESFEDSILSKQIFSFSELKSLGSN